MRQVVYLECGVPLVGDADEVGHAGHVVLHAGAQRDRDLLTASGARVRLGDTRHASRALATQCQHHHQQQQQHGRVVERRPARHSAVDFRDEYVKFQQFQSV